ncbi:helix-turn-helix domain-containing protein [Loigolactobacillus coryniformis]|uniref:helix-turn-helix domain-containing protein n=1 Tax=Loigolactobacillus coryniformis TaxID=1610 RepID=UPI001C5E9F41|nr:helix-turn-helix transcriptional regulator [Loigolactobacillus coryniformis]MBW4801244.1 helix-turn-helix transcriptional regulator [Loigolactobacillus coryniformis subsp. torquens]MBW4803947.1 helix-turn-helix transcriptional regulator [Loigolactobacillus coryniformis subsp. torquens]MDC4186335.1 helix-turn-helix domain-containing protein [Loigolactobacillus coryniformis]
MQLGAQLKSARQKLGVTQEIVAVELHVSRQTISSWENERSYPDIASLIALSDYYQLSLDELLKEDNGMADDLARKERALKEAQRIWLMSYVVNLLLLLLLLADRFSWFGVKLTGAVAFVIAMVMLVNGYLLIMAGGSYRRLKRTDPFLITNRTLRFIVSMGIITVGLILCILQRKYLFTLGAVSGALIAYLLFRHRQNKAI